jgi:hypothetical protein
MNTPTRFIKRTNRLSQSQLAHLAATPSAQLAFYRHAQTPIPGQDADVSVPAWLAGGFAILMVVTAGYCAAR